MKIQVGHPAAAGRSWNRHSREVVGVPSITNSNHKATGLEDCILSVAPWQVPSSCVHTGFCGRLKQWKKLQLLQEICSRFLPPDWWVMPTMSFLSTARADTTNLRAQKTKMAVPTCRLPWASYPTCQSAKNIYLEPNSSGFEPHHLLSLLQPRR